MYWDFQRIFFFFFTKTHFCYNFTPIYNKYSKYLKNRILILCSNFCVHYYRKIPEFLFLLFFPGLYTWMCFKPLIVFVQNGKKKKKMSFSYLPSILWDLLQGHHRHVETAGASVTKMRSVLVIMGEVKWRGSHYFNSSVSQKTVKHAFSQTQTDKTQQAVYRQWSLVYSILVQAQRLVIQLQCEHVLFGLWPVRILKACRVYLITRITYIR